jgi:CheY-like chemotaxis protein
MKVLIADAAGALTPASVVLLSMWGHDVAVATDGPDALRRARAWSPDVVLVESRLERMGGLALAAAIAGVAEPHRPRVVLACRPADAYARRGAEAPGREVHQVARRRGGAAARARAAQRREGGSAAPPPWREGVTLTSLRAPAELRTCR